MDTWLSIGDCQRRLSRAEKRLEELENKARGLQPKEEKTPTYLSALMDFADCIAVRGGALSEVRVDAETYCAFWEELKLERIPRTNPIDLHRFRVATSAGWVDVVRGNPR